MAASLTFDGWENGYKSVNVTAPVHNGAAGGYRMRDVDTNSSFIVFCLDLLAVVRSGITYGYNATNTPFSNSVNLFGNGAVGRIQRIFDAGYDTAFDSSANSAGFQVALWNAVYDTDWSVSASEGSFYQTSSNDGVRAVANNYLDLAKNYDGESKWLMTFLEGQSIDPRSQNLVTVSPGPGDSMTPVPLPAAAWMLLSALGGLAFLRCRTQATS